MLRRVGIVLAARLAAGNAGGSQASALMTQAVVAAFFCAIVRDALTPFQYALFAFTLTAMMVAIPLIGELGWILRRDAAEDWISAQPIRARELQLARTAHLLVLLFVLALGSLVPAALFAPSGTPLVARLALPLLGLGLTSLLAALLLFVQNALGERAEGLLVAFQTILVVGVVLGVVLGIRSIPTLARLPDPSAPEASALWAFPPTWFAAPLANVSAAAGWGVAALACTGAILLLLALPPSARARSVRTPWLSVLLTPARALATRVWVRPDERGPFDLVYDALPREREVVLRTVPMVGIPMAFLFVATTGEAGGSSARADLLALLLFAAGVYLPILLTHVPASASARAAWVLETAPVPEGAIRSGTIKALAVRFLVPLYVVLAIAGWSIGGAGIVVQLAVPGFLVSLLVLRRLYSACVTAAPLSVPADELDFGRDWMGLLGGLAMLLVGVAVAANRLLTPAIGVGLVVLLLVVDVAADRATRRRWG